MTNKELFEIHPLPWKAKAFGDDDTFIRDAEGNALISVGYNSSLRDEIMNLIVKTINKLKVEDGES